MEKCGRVYGVSGERCGRVYGERKCVGMWGKDVGGVEKCVRVWGPNTLPHISSLTSTFPTSPLTSPTQQRTFLHLPHIPLPTPQHIFLLSPHLPSQSVAKCLWRSYWQPPIIGCALSTELSRSRGNLAQNGA